MTEDEKRQLAAVPKLLKAAKLAWTMLNIVDDGDAHVISRDRVQLAMNRCVEAIQAALPELKESAEFIVWEDGEFLPPDKSFLPVRHWTTEELIQDALDQNVVASRTELPYVDKDGRISVDDLKALHAWLVRHVEISK